jgi:adenine/guanine phosphoribosyltransferase-like PRPP-binding protein
VCRGVSGLVYAAPLSIATGLPLAVVRKNDRESSHSDMTVEGWIGDNVRYAFIDDFISSGNTFNKCVAAVAPAQVVVALIMHNTSDYASEVEPNDVPVHGVGNGNL